jgi:hypothetical protein
VRERYTAERMVERTLEVYERVAAHPHATVPD